MSSVSPKQYDFRILQRIRDLLGFHKLGFLCLTKLLIQPKALFNETYFCKNPAIVKAIS